MVSIKIIKHEDVLVGLVLRPHERDERPPSVIGYGLKRGGVIERFESLELLARTMHASHLNPARIPLSAEGPTFVNLPTFSWYQLQLELIGAGRVLVPDTDAVS